MNFNKILQSLFGNKSSRDMKVIQPIVEQVKKAYPEIKALSNDELRARTNEIKKYVQDSASEQKKKIADFCSKAEAMKKKLKEVVAEMEAAVIEKKALAMKCDDLLQDFIAEQVFKENALKEVDVFSKRLEDARE